MEKKKWEAPQIINLSALPETLGYCSTGTSAALSGSSLGFCTNGTGNINNKVGAPGSCSSGNLPN